MKGFKRRAEPFLNTLIASEKVSFAFITELFPRNYNFEALFILALKKTRKDHHSEFLQGVLCLFTRGTVEPLTHVASPRLSKASARFH